MNKKILKTEQSQSDRQSGRHLAFEENWFSYRQAFL